jgi:hypothetical protein
MILDEHIAVVFRPSGEGRPHPELAILNPKGWNYLQLQAQLGNFVILEAWDITKGKCISN